MSCGNANFNSNADHSSTQEIEGSKELDSAIVATFNIYDAKENIGMDDDNLFGKFYNDRIEFHIVDHPTIEIFNTPVKRMTLYFIDSVLCKKKYELENDISNELMKNLGSFKFQPMGLESMNAAKKNGVIMYQTKGPILNPHLTKYQMKWLLDDRTVLFRHQEDSLVESNLYEEQLPEYTRLFKAAQRNMN